MCLRLQIKVLQDNSTCRTLCTTSVPSEDAKFINDRIREDYALNWLIDGLPAAEMKKDLKTGDIFFDMGFNLGNDDDETPYLNNHYEIVLRSDVPGTLIRRIYLTWVSYRYHEPSPGVYRIVGVLVWPSRSVGIRTRCQDSQSCIVVVDHSSLMI